MTAIEDLVGRNVALRSDTGPGVLVAQPGLRVAVGGFVVDIENSDLGEVPPSQP